MGELCENVQELPFETVLSKYQPLIEKSVGSFASTASADDVSVSGEDMRQEAALALYIAYRSYRPGRGTTFGLYAGVCIRNRLCSLFRKKKPWESVPLDEETLPPSQDDPVLSLENAEGEGSLLRYLESRLTEREYSVLRAYLDGNSYAQISAILGVGEKAVDNAMARVRAKLRDGGIHCLD